MYGTPAKILNAIAKSQKLRTPGYRVLFKLNDAQLMTALDSQMDALESHGTPPKVAMLYVKIAPLLAENEAISEYIMKTDHSSLRQVLPEIISLREALIVAEMESPMSDKERLTLATLLRPLVPIPT